MNLIGNTPMIKITYKYEDKIQSVYAKLEYYNFTGSIKDRIAYQIIKNAKEKGTLKEKQPIIEVSSGNTGISFSAMGALYKHPVHIFMPNWVSKERQMIMQMYGANIHFISRKDGGFRAGLEKAEKFSKKIGGYRPNQFDNYENVLTHYNTTAIEILNQFKNVDSFVSGIGTGGTIIGIGKRLKKVSPKTKIFALEPDSLPIISKGITRGIHKIEGIGDDFIPSIVDETIIDEIVLINDDDAINMANLISKQLGIGVGISSGANFLAAVLKNKTNRLVTVFPDDNKKYLTTSLSNSIDSNTKFISNKIQLLDFENI